MRLREEMTRSLVKGCNNREQCDGPCCTRDLADTRTKMMCEICGAIDNAGRFKTDDNGIVRCNSAFVCTKELGYSPKQPA